VQTEKKEGEPKARKLDRVTKRTKALKPSLDRAPEKEKKDKGGEEKSKNTGENTAHKAKHRGPR